MSELVHCAESLILRKQRLFQCELISEASFLIQSASAKFSSQRHEPEKLILKYIYSVHRKIALLLAKVCFAKLGEFFRGGHASTSAGSRGKFHQAMKEALNAEFR